MYLQDSEYFLQLPKRIFQIAVRTGSLRHSSGVSLNCIELHVTCVEPSHSWKEVKLYWVWEEEAAGDSCVCACLIVRIMVSRTCAKGSDAKRMKS